MRKLKRATGFDAHMAALCKPLLSDDHSGPVERLKACRGVADLIDLAQADQGWLMPPVRRGKPRLKLVQHGTGTFLVVEYVDGWSKTLSKELFPGGAIRR